jgi:hypothetical protein
MAREGRLVAPMEKSICGLAQASPSPVRGAMGHRPELLAPLGEAVLS